MKCDNIYEDIADYIDFRLDEFSVQSFEEHMKTCSKCQNNFEQVEKIMLSLRGISDIDEPTYLKDNIMNKILKKDTKKIYYNVKWISFAGVFVLAIAIVYSIPLKGKKEENMLNTGALARDTIPFKDEPNEDIKPSVTQNAKLIFPGPNGENISYIYEKELKIEDENKGLLHHLKLSKGEKCSIYVENKQKDDINIIFKDVYDNEIGEVYTVGEGENKEVIFTTPDDALEEDVYIVEINSKNKKYIEAYTRVMVIVD